MVDALTRFFYHGTYATRFCRDRILKRVGVSSTCVLLVCETGRTLIARRGLYFAFANGFVVKVVGQRQSRGRVVFFTYLFRYSMGMQGGSMAGLGGVLRVVTIFGTMALLVSYTRDNVIARGQDGRARYGRAGGGIANYILIGTSRVYATMRGTTRVYQQRRFRIGGGIQPPEIIVTRPSAT